MLVHICCAPDALYVMDLLGKEYDVSGFFYNPNIHPREEYDLRLKETQKVADSLGFETIEGPYENSRWHTITTKFKDEPEKGRRCDVCYALRLERTAKKGAELGFDIFTTVMSLSPWKKAGIMNKIGKMFGHRFQIEFLEANFKKKDGFKKSAELSKQYKLYRQRYCGCLYSIRGRSPDTFSPIKVRGNK
ncbi:MAG: epoxyqueuosine reductase QueH [Candidatus Aminicenantes bacterium]|nr:MAG: epoxyqueuosine reductase QueH [Candidatus Aminicenantes bacterium]